MPRASVVPVEPVSPTSVGISKRPWEDQLVSEVTRSKETGQYSDLTIICGSRQFKVHRNIVCPQSKFFEVACNSGFKEASTGEILLPEDDPNEIEHLIAYLYTGKYDKLGENDGQTLTRCNVVEASQSRLLRLFVLGKISLTFELYQFNPDGNFFSGNPSGSVVGSDLPCGSFLDDVRMFAIADKYLIPTLRDVVFRTIKARLDRKWKVHDFCSAVKEAYLLRGSTIPELTEFIASNAFRRRNKLHEHQAFDELIAEVGLFARDLLVQSWNAEILLGAEPNPAQEVKKRSTPRKRPRGS
ncbi:MAG: hypothetical protein M1819_006810 [Sarea resinae]|nr:MAG: hypothetical protein M1819_006810 [Sarea resinae]